MRPPPSNALVNQLVVLTLGFLVFSGSLGLGAVWVRQEMFSTANRSRSLEVKLADVERRLDEVNAEVAAALNPDVLEHQNQLMKLGLARPQELQVVRVDISPTDNLSRKLFRQGVEPGIEATGRLGDADDQRASRNQVSFRVIAASLR